MHSAVWHPKWGLFLSLSLPPPHTYFLLFCFFVLNRNIYGRVLWDTHTYHFPPGGTTWTIQQAKNAFSWDLQQIETFHNRQNRTVFVGEYCLASMNSDFNEWAHWLVQEFATRGMGSSFWHYDAPYDSWSMQRSAQFQGVNWPSAFGI